MKKLEILCPFCGVENNLTVFQAGQNAEFKVKCNSCAREFKINSEGSVLDFPSPRVPVARAVTGPNFDPRDGPTGPTFSHQGPPSELYPPQQPGQGPPGFQPRDPRSPRSQQPEIPANIIPQSPRSRSPTIKPPSPAIKSPSSTVKSPSPTVKSQPPAKTNDPIHPPDMDSNRSPRPSPSKASNDPLSQEDELIRELEEAERNFPSYGKDSDRSPSGEERGGGTAPDRKTPQHGSGNSGLPLDPNIPSSPGHYHPYGGTPDPRSSYPAPGQYPYHQPYLPHDPSQYPQHLQFPYIRTPFMRNPMVVWKLLTVSAIFGILTAILFSYIIYDNLHGGTTDMTFRGTVTDGNGDPIPGAIVLLVEENLTTTTDGQGRFNFTDLSSGTITVHFNATGYRDLNYLFTLWPEGYTATPEIEKDFTMDVYTKENPDSHEIDESMGNDLYMFPTLFMIFSTITFVGGIFARKLVHWRSCVFAGVAGIISWGLFVSTILCIFVIIILFNTRYAFRKGDPHMSKQPEQRSDDTDPKK